MIRSRLSGRYIKPPVQVPQKIIIVLVLAGLCHLGGLMIGWNLQDYLNPEIKSPIPAHYEFEAQTPYVIVHNKVEKPAEHYEAVSWEEFQSIAKTIAEEEDYPYAVLIGQAALETGRGRSHFAMTRFNYFGIAAYDSNPNAAHSYSSVEEGIRAYISLIKTAPRYQRAWSQKHNPVAMVKAIKAAGYASDPLYVEKVTGMPEFQGN